MSQWQNPIEVLKKLEARPKRSLSQNFMISQDAARKVSAELGDIRPGEIAFEIGAGTGSLTAVLAEKFKKVIAAEIDERLAAELAKRFEGSNVTVINADVLKLDFRRLAEENGGAMRFAGNLPYDVSTPIIEKFLREKDAANGASFLLQKEFVAKMTTPPGRRESSPAAVFCGVYFEAKKGAALPPSAFMPQPKVDSAVLNLIPRSKPLIEGRPPDLYKLIYAAFSRRRRLLSSNLTNAGIPKSAVEAVYKKASLPGSLRAEEADFKTWEVLYAGLEEYLINLPAGR